MRQPHSRFKKTLVTACLLVLTASSATAVQLENGLAIITSRQGNVSLSTAGQKERTARLHEVIELNSATIVSESDERLMLALSNGIGLGIDQGTEVEIQNYRQRPFKEFKENRDYEPSESRLTLSLNRGSIAIAANRLSPLSLITIKLPNGEVRVHSVTCYIRYDEMGTHISALEGNVTYHYPDSENREFINTPEFVRVSNQSALLGEVAEIDDINESMDEESLRMVEATNRATNRVIYKLKDGVEGIPEPVLIAKPTDLKQPSPRPYQYLD